MVDGRSDIFAQPRRCETRLSSAPAVSVRLGRQRDWFMNSGSRRHVGPVRHTPGMGRRNRERRTTKQKQRRRSAADREHRPSDIGPDRAQILESLVIAMSTAARSPGPGRAVELVEQCRGFERQLDIAADLVVHDAVRAAWEHGWSPMDLHEIARRRLDAARRRRRRSGFARRLRSR